MDAITAFSQPGSPPASPLTGRAVRRAALVAFATALAAAVLFDRWYAAHLQDELRTRVRTEVAPTVEALRSAVDRRVALLEGLRSFADSRPTRALLDAQFPLYADGLLTGISGVRTLQFVQDGRIVDTWPLQGNEAALGYNLATDPRAEIRDGLRRGMELPGPIVTGPISLVQGGTGLLVRTRLIPRPGFPDLAAIILDVPALVAEAGIGGVGVPGLVLEVRDRQGRWFGGDSAGSTVDPVIAIVDVPDGDWELWVAPVRGWSAAVAADLRISRLGLLGFVLAFTLAGVLVGQRQGRLVQEVADREDQLGMVLRAGRMGTWVIDIPGDHLTFDEAGAAILGRTPDEVDGSLERLFHLLHPEDAAFVARVFSETLGSDRGDYTLEHRVVMPDGSTRWVFVTGDVERDPQGRALRARGVITDASDRRAIESRARQTERVEVLGTMAGGVAHDFNNLLAAMAGCTELALQQLRDPSREPADPAVLEDLEEVLRIAERAQGLTKQLLAFSRGSTTEPRRVDLAQTLTEMEPLMQRVLGRRIGLTLLVDAKAPQVWIDPSQFTQVVLNLVVNARDAIAENGQVQVTLRQRDVADVGAEGLPAGRWVELQVEDSGAGIPAEVRERIFEPYFSTKAQGRGTGLGLSVVLGVVRAAGGHAFVDSEVGKGTRFRILLPPYDRPSRVRSSGPTEALAS